MSAQGKEVMLVLVTIIVVFLFFIWALSMFRQAGRSAGRVAGIILVILVIAMLIDPPSTKSLIFQVIGAFKELILTIRDALLR